MTPNRRGFIGRAVAVIVGCFAMVQKPTPTRRFGLITLDWYHMFQAETGKTLSVYLDGVDVTRNCWEADDVNGYVNVRCCDLDTHSRLDGRDHHHLAKDKKSVCGYTRTGDVVIRLDQ